MPPRQRMQGPAARQAAGPPIPVPDYTGFGPIDAGVLEFTVEGEQYALLVPDDGRLLAAYASEDNWQGIVPGLLHPDDEDEFLDRLDDFDDPLCLRTCWRLTQHLAPDIYGVEWWTATRLCASARAAWPQFSSWAVTNGFDPGTAPVHRLVSATLAWVMAGADDEKDRRSLERKIFDPPRTPLRKGAAPRRGFSPEEQAASFAAAMAALGEG